MNYFTCIYKLVCGCLLGLLSIASSEGEVRAEPIPDQFSGTKLLAQLGSVLPAASMQELIKMGDLPETRAAALVPGGRFYVLGVQPQGGLVLHLGADNTLLSFGFVSGPESQALFPEEQQLFTGFESEGEPEVTVLDETFNPASMRIKTFRSKSSPTKKALIYTHQKSRNIVFYESSRVQMSKLLPASPEEMDPSVLKQLRSLVKPTE